MPDRREELETIIRGGLTELRAMEEMLDAFRPESEVEAEWLKRTKAQFWMAAEKAGVTGLMRFGGWHD